MSDDRTIYNLPIAPPKDPDAAPERSKIHIGSVEGPRAAARLQLSQVKKAQTVQAKKPKPRISGGRLGVHRK